jgi:hypothetical protein
MRRKDGLLQINDMRYGTFDGKDVNEDSYIFRFVVDKRENGNYQLQTADGGPKRGSEEEIFSKLFERISGI